MEAVPRAEQRVRGGQGPRSPGQGAVRRRGRLRAEAPEKSTGTIWAGDWDCQPAGDRKLLAKDPCQPKQLRAN